MSAAADAVTPSIATGTRRPHGPAPADLSLDGVGVVAMLQRCVADGAWLDAFLCAAAACQLVDDALHPDPLSLRRAASFLSTAHGRPGRVAAAIASGGAALGAASRAGPRARALTTLHPDLARLVGLLAAAVLQPERPVDVALARALTQRSRPVADFLGQEIIRLPACFRSFDQHTEDSLWLARAVDEQALGADQPVAVVGVRTSGSYLAPLLAAALQLSGRRRVVVSTYRPARPFLRWERAQLQDVVHAGGRVLVTDDPPGSGSSLAAAVRAIEHAGVDRDLVTLVLSLLDGQTTLPPPLHGLSAVVQPWPEWSVHRRLAPQSIAETLGQLVGPEVEVVGLRRGPEPVATGHRRHQRARYTLCTLDREAQPETREIVAEGVGVGFLGQQALTVAGALSHHVPAVLGLADGVLIREWLPSGHPRDVVPSVVSYVRARERHLPARRDPTPGLIGRDPVWEVASELLSGGFGPLGPLARVTLLNRLARTLLAVERPVLVDGDTDVRKWLLDASGTARKVDFHERGFSHLELLCYDAAFDLAGAAADPPTPELGDALRMEYERSGGTPIDAERWLLYRLAQLWRAGRAGDVSASRVSRRSAAAVNDYLAEVLLADTDPPRDGPLCAVDLDGVLETDVLGYPAAAPLGTLALRALQRHGYRPVLVTGRGLDDARERCAAFGLAGVVAEYGTVVAVAGDPDQPLCSGPELAHLADVRERVSALADVTVDPGHRWVVRARYRDGAVPDGLLDRSGVAADPVLRVIQGQGQTDITVARLDKGTGLDRLASLLDEPDCALAVGDSGADLAMFPRARLARAPGNADATVRASSVRRTRHQYQAGLADACADLLGHRIGGCPRCRPPALPRRTEALLTVLGVRQDGLRSVPGAALRLTGLVYGAGPW